MPLFKLKKSGGPRDLDLSMAGLKLGSRVLQLGNDGELIAVLAGAVGISGEACSVTADEAAAGRIGRAAAAAGVLVDVRVAPFGALPYDADAFDVVVLADMIGSLHISERVVCLQQVLRVLRPGGALPGHRAGRARRSRCRLLATVARSGLPRRRRSGGGPCRRGLPRGSRACRAQRQELHRGDQVVSSRERTRSANPDA